MNSIQMLDSFSFTNAWISRATVSKISGSLTDLLDSERVMSPGRGQVNWRVELYGGARHSPDGEWLASHLVWDLGFGVSGTGSGCRL
jgi:hypothetical protein